MAILNAFHEAQKHFLEGDLQASIKSFSCALAGNLEPYRSHLSRGVAYLKTGDIDKALEDFDAAVHYDGSQERAYFYRGIGFLNKGKYEEAISDLNESLKENPERGPALLARGLAHAELHHDSEADRDIRSAYAKTNMEIGEFIEEYAVSRTMFERSIALFDGDRGPWKHVMTEDEVVRMNQYQ